MREAREILAALEGIDRRGNGRQRRTAARDAALLVLYAAGIGPLELSRLTRAHLDVGPGGVTVALTGTNRDRCTRYLVLEPPGITRWSVQRIIQELLEVELTEARSAGRTDGERPLFHGRDGPLSPGAIIKVLTRRIRGPGAATRRARR